MNDMKRDLENAIRHAIDKMGDDSPPTNEEFNTHVRHFLCDLGYPQEVTDRIQIQYDSASECANCGACDEIGKLINSIGSNKAN